ncbi:Protein NRT1/ PTR FAMILY 7.3 [Glycine soja]
MNSTTQGMTQALYAGEHLCRMMDNDGCSPDWRLYPIFVQMSEELSYKSSLNVPLLPEWKHNDEDKAIASHPSTKNSVSFFRTCLKGLNAISGVGILSVPYALASGGWLSLVLLFAIATTAFYTGMLIKRCMDKYSNIRTYPDIGELAFGKTGRLIVSVSMYTELYLVSIGFLILEGDNLSNLFPIGEVQIAGLAIGGKQFFVILVSLIILPTVWLDNLSLLSYVSASGVFASAFIILSISWTATFDEVGFHQKGTSVNWNGIPTAVSLYAFCYCAHPVFPTLYNSMTNKHQFSNVLLLCFLLTTVGYASMAIIGYLMFGADVESQITLNLPLNKVSSKLAIYITLVNPISKYALMATPITNALKDLLPSTYKNRVTNILVSTVMVIGTTIVALVVPFYGYLMSLVGAFLSVTASILLPCFCYLKISGSYRRFECETVIIVIIIIPAIVMGISGSYNSVMEIVHQFSVTDFNPPTKIKPLRFANLCLLQTIQLFSSVSVSIFVQKSKNFPHNSSLNVPLLPESGHAKDEEKVTDSYPSTENTASFFHTCFNGLNAISGVGILSCPYTLASRGWLSLAFLFAIASATFYTGILIKRCMDTSSNIRSYPDRVSLGTSSGWILRISSPTPNPNLIIEQNPIPTPINSNFFRELAFGKTGRLMISGLMYTELYLVSIGFLILEGDNLSNLFPNREIQIAGFVIGGKQLFVILVALIILPTDKIKGKVNRDNEVCTSDGAIDSHGHPAVLKRTGTWTTGILILVNQGLATLAFFGVGVNLVLFLTRVMGQDNAEAANNVSKWTGTVYLFSLLGAFLSDSYWGRYMTCAIFQVIFVIGLVSLSLSSHISLLKPSGCGDKELQCGSHSSSQTALFYLSIYLVALGNGGYQPNIATFGSDQFDEGDPKERLSKVAFFSYFYLALNLGSLFSNTILDYFEDKGQWTLGFWASAGSAAIALILFLCGTRRYRYFKPVGNPLPRVGQVFVAAGKKWKVKVLSEENLYEDEESSPSGRRKMLHTEGFRFLDKAAFITSKDLEQLEENKRNPWCLSTVTQVEEVKCILRLLPIWLCTIMYSVVFAQMASLFVVQGDAMATGISSFKIPPASMSSFDILGVAFFIFIYRHALDPFVAKVMKSKLTELQRMGIGLVLAIMAMVSAGLVEKFRLKYAIKDCNQCDGSSSLSIFWQVPQYVLTGASEVFMYVPQLEFFNAQTPDGLKSFGSALCMTSISLGNYVSSLLVAIVMKISTKGDIPGWIPGNLNLGHLDRFYFLLAALTTADLVVYVALAKWYKSIQFEENAEEDIKKENHEVMV